MKGQENMDWREQSVTSSGTFLNNILVVLFKLFWMNGGLGGVRVCVCVCVCACVCVLFVELTQQCGCLGDPVVTGSRGWQQNRHHKVSGVTWRRESTHIINPPILYLTGWKLFEIKIHFSRE